VNFQEIKNQVVEYSLDQKRALAIGAVSALCISLFLLLISRGEAVEKPQVRVVEQQISATLLVHVAGEVKRPGVYPLVSGSRVIDAIKAAGGAKVGTDLSQLNLARLIADGEQIYLGRENLSEVKTSRKSKEPFRGIVYINRATSAQFDSLPGIGETFAKRIIEYRKTNGPFVSIEDLMKVEGIGEKTYAKMKSRLSL
jgi:competence protein ComEA